MTPLRALFWLTMGLLQRLAREGMIVRSLVFPTTLVIGTLLATLGVMAAIRSPQTVALVPGDGAIAAVEQAGFLVVEIDEPAVAMERGAVWASVDDRAIAANADGLELRLLESVIREARGSQWRPSAIVPRPSNVQSQPVALRIARLLAILFTLYGVVFGAGMLARDREDGTLEAELALPMPKWTPAAARFLAGSAGLAAFFAGGVFLVDAMLDLESPLRMIGHGGAAAAGATAIGLGSAGRSTLKSGFSTTLAVSMTAVSALGAAGAASESLRFLPVASLAGDGPVLVPMLLSLVLGAMASWWFAWSAR